MKNKLKILLIMIVLVIAIVCVYIFLKGMALVQGTTSAIVDKLDVTQEKMINDYKNVYSVSYNQQLMTKDNACVFETTSIAQIRGEDVTFINYYTGSADYKTKNETITTGNTCLENNIMAAIASGAGVVNKGYKYMENGEYYSSGAQLAIWEFWNTWVENSGATEVGFEKGIGNGTITENGLNGEEQRKIAQNLAIQNEYEVNIYFLRYFKHNNQVSGGETNLDNQPNLIFIEVLGETIKPEPEIIESDDIAILISNTIQGVVKPGENLTYYIGIHNTGEEEQQNLLMNNILPENTTLEKIEEISNNNNKVQLNENVDYSYNKETRTISRNIDKIDSTIKTTQINEETGEEEETEIMGYIMYVITVKVDQLDDGVYSKEIKNIVQILKDNTILVRNNISNTISDAYLELEIEELPEEINEGESCILNLRITNKGLVPASDVDINIIIPEQITPKLYKLYQLSETGVQENTSEGVLANEFQRYLEIPAQKTFCIQLTGSVNDIEETKQITIEGTVNGEKISWITKLSKNEEGGC